MFLKWNRMEMKQYTLKLRTLLKFKYSKRISKNYDNSWYNYTYSEKKQNGIETKYLKV